MATVEERLNRLEAQVRTWRLIAGFAAVLALAAGAAIGLRPPLPDYLQADRVELRGADGRTLTLSGDGWELRSGERSLARLGTEAEGHAAELTLKHSAEKGGDLLLRAAEDGATVLLREDRMERAVALGAGKRQAGLHIDGRDSTATATLRIAGIDPDPDDDVELVLAQGDAVEPITLNPEESAEREREQAKALDKLREEAEAATDVAEAAADTATAAKKQAEGAAQ